MLYISVSTVLFYLYHILPLYIQILFSNIIFNIIPIPIQIKMFYRCYYYNVIQISILYDFEFENVETKTNLKSSQRCFE